jgi:hypothetical protein
MEAVFSKLHTIDFRVIESKFSTVEQPNQKSELVDLSKLPIDIEFAVADNLQDKGVFAMHIDCTVNSNAIEFGYSIQLKAVGIFQMDMDSLEQTEQINLKTISPLSLMIGNVRGFLRDITSYGIYGAYQLPSIDIVHLIKQTASVKGKKKTPLGAQ